MSDVTTSSESMPWDAEQTQPQEDAGGSSVRDAGPVGEATPVEATDDGAAQTEVPNTEGEPASETPTKRKRQNLRPRGWLELDVKSITDKFVTGEISLPEGQHMTPHRVAQLVKELESLEAPPSSGAVAAVFKRWDELGFAQIGTKPVAFIDYTDEGRSTGLSALKEQRSASIKKIRAAAKEAETAASATDSGSGAQDSATDSGENPPS